jgi:hypothetical protein
MSASPDQNNVEVVHEESDVNVSAIIRWGGTLAGVTLSALAFLVWLQGMYMRAPEQVQQARYPMAAERRGELPPEPRLQDSPQQDLRALRAKQLALLTQYGWVNEESGIARIPIEEAMRLVVERGLPVRDASK